MNNSENPEKILDKWYTPLYPLGDIAKLEILEAMKEYARQIRDKTLEWAANNVKTIKEVEATILREEKIITEYEDDGRWCTYYRASPKSILNGKTHKDLEI